MGKIFICLLESAVSQVIALTVIYDIEVWGPTKSPEENTLKENLIFLDRFSSQCFGTPWHP